MYRVSREGGRRSNHAPATPPRDFRQKFDEVRERGHMANRSFLHSVPNPGHRLWLKIGGVIFLLLIIRRVHHDMCPDVSSEELHVLETKLREEQELRQAAQDRMADMMANSRGKAGLPGSTFSGENQAEDASQADRDEAFPEPVGHALLPEEDVQRLIKEREDQFKEETSDLELLRHQNEKLADEVAHLKDQLEQMGNRQLPERPLLSEELAVQAETSFDSADDGQDNGSEGQGNPVPFDVEPGIGGSGDGGSTSGDALERDILGEEDKHEDEDIEVVDIGRAKKDVLEQAEVDAGTRKKRDRWPLPVEGWIMPDDTVADAPSGQLDANRSPGEGSDEADAGEIISQTGEEGEDGHLAKYHEDEWSASSTLLRTRNKSNTKHDRKVANAVSAINEGDGSVGQDVVNRASDRSSREEESPDDREGTSEPSFSSEEPDTDEGHSHAEEAEMEFEVEDKRQQAKLDAINARGEEGSSRHEQFSEKNAEEEPNSSGEVLHNIAGATSLGNDNVNKPEERATGEDRSKHKLRPFLRGSLRDPDIEPDDETNRRAEGHDGQLLDGHDLVDPASAEKHSVAPTIGIGVAGLRHGSREEEIQAEIFEGDEPEEGISDGDSGDASPHVVNQKHYTGVASAGNSGVQGNSDKGPDQFEDNRDEGEPGSIVIADALPAGTVVQNDGADGADDGKKQSRGGDKLLRAGEGEEIGTLPLLIASEKEDVEQMIVAEKLDKGEPAPEGNERLSDAAPTRQRGETGEDVGAKGIHDLTVDVAEEVPSATEPKAKNTEPISLAAAEGAAMVAADGGHQLVDKISQGGAGRMEKGIQESEMPGMARGADPANPLGETDAEPEVAKEEEGSASIELAQITEDDASEEVLEEEVEEAEEQLRETKQGEDRQDDGGGSGSGSGSNDRSGQYEEKTSRGYTSQSELTDDDEARSGRSSASLPGRSSRSSHTSSDDDVISSVRSDSMVRSSDDDDDDDAEPLVRTKPLPPEIPGDVKDARDQVTKQHMAAMLGISNQKAHSE